MAAKSMLGGGMGRSMFGMYDWLADQDLLTPLVFLKLFGTLLALELSPAWLLFQIAVI